jgi:hypothetical protein
LDRKPDFWRRLLTAAKYEDIKALKALRHQAKRVFFGEVRQASQLC